MNWTVLEVLNWTAAKLGEVGATSARLDAELLLGKTLGLERIQLYVQYQRPLTAEEREAYRALVKRRLNGEPVQYILGSQEFWSIAFEVGPGVLIPRSDTEVLVEEALAEARRIAGGRGHEALALADVGTGSGCIAVALLSELKEARAWAGDVAQVPLALAPKNAASAGVGDRFEIVQGAGLLPLFERRGREPFDLVVSNPPYIREADMPGLMREVRDHEPHQALVAGPEGMDVVRSLIREVAEPGLLHPDGAVVIEIGDREQAAETARRLEEAGFAATRIRRDYGGRPRAVVGSERPR